MADQATGNEQQHNASSAQAHAESLRDRAVEGARVAASKAGDYGQEAARHYVREPASDVFSLLRDYAREKPDVAAAWCFFVGILVGWKLKP